MNRAELRRAQKLARKPNRPRKGPYFPTMMDTAAAFYQADAMFQQLSKGELNTINNIPCMLIEGEWVDIHSTFSGWIETWQRILAKAGRQINLSALEDLNRAFYSDLPITEQMYKDALAVHHQLKQVYRTTDTAITGSISRGQEIKYHLEAIEEAA